MDTSEKYIEMCREATQVQKCWEPTYNDLSFCVAANHIVTVNISLIGMLNIGLASLNTSLNYFWLPRQDQLQEMVLEELKQQDNILKFSGTKRWELVYDIENNKYVGGDTMEQMWLSYVMIIKHGMIWGTIDIKEIDEWIPVESI